ncbi:MAG: MBL fold metallo-hydrolase [Pseudolabrys sp.]|nr:MBL fold metallo-hydrolase [Pseudolabrys sp.]
METKIAEIADGIFRLSTFVPQIAEPAGFAFNSFLVRGEQPLLFHTGLRKMFPLNRDAVAKLIPVETLRWIAFGHYEADECGAMNEWMAAAPNAQVAHGATGVMVSLNDMADRAPRILADNEAIDLGGKRVRYIDTPHTPHGWDAGVMYEESTGTLLCGDLFTQLGDNPALVHGGDIVGPAIQGENLFQYSALAPGMGSAIRRLAPLKPKTLALMHGPSFAGDGAAAINALADFYEKRTGDRFAEMMQAKAA